MTLLVAILAIAGVVNTWFVGTLFQQARTALVPLQQKAGMEWLPVRWFAKGALCHFCFSHWVGIAFGIGYYLKPAETWIAMLMMAAIYVSGPVLMLYTLLTVKVPQMVDASLALKSREVQRADRDQQRAA